MASWPLNPANGDRHKEGDRTWIYNGGIWDSVGEPTNKVFSAIQGGASNSFDINNSSIYYNGDMGIKTNGTYEIWTKMGLYGINSTDNSKMRVVIWSTNADGSAKTNILDYFSFNVVSKHVKSYRLNNTGGDYIDVELTLNGFDARSTYEDFNFLLKAKSKAALGAGRFYLGLGNVSGFSQFVQFAIWRSLDIFEISKW